ARAESGAQEAARATAEAAVEAARRHGTRRWVYAAHLAGAQAALSAPDPIERDRIEHALTQAPGAIRDTQAWGPEPFIVLARARGWPSGSRMPSPPRSYATRPGRSSRGSERTRMLHVSRQAPGRSYRRIGERVASLPPWSLPLVLPDDGPLFAAVTQP